MRRNILLLTAVLAVLAGGPASATEDAAVAGRWAARLPVAQPPIEVVVEIEGGDEMSGSVTSPSHPDLELKILDIRVEGTTVRFRLDGLPGDVSFEGKVAPGGAAIVGGLSYTPQAVPMTDIHLLEFDASSLPWKIVAASNVTDRDGYDSQPYFTPDRKALLYTSIRNRQADIYRYVLESGATERLTETDDTSEYSPTPLPEGGGFSTVRVEEDGTQRLWAFDDEGKGPRLLLERVQPVGYHAWLDAATLALFVLGTPNTLQIASLETGKVTTAAESIGRALHRTPEAETVTFVHKRSEDDWRIVELAPGGSPREIVPAVPGSEDFTYLPDGTLLTGDGSLLKAFRAGMDGWTDVADLEVHGIRGITRLAASRDGRLLAVVGERDGGEPPAPQEEPLTLLRVRD